MYHRPCYTVCATKGGDSAREGKNVILVKTHFPICPISIGPNRKVVHPIIISDIHNLIDETGLRGPFSDLSDEIGGFSD
jgi:hypothetical protein